MSVNDNSEQETVTKESEWRMIMEKIEKDEKEKKASETVIL